MKTYLLPLALLLTACATEKEGSTEAPNSRLGFQPNILVLVAEDLSPRLGCYGDPVAQTPHLDKLADEGVRFTRMFDYNPICAPTRAGLITGLYPSTFSANDMRTHKYVPQGVPVHEAVPPPSPRLYTATLQEQGYFTTNNSKEDYQFDYPDMLWNENSEAAHWRHRRPGQPFYAIFNNSITHESGTWRFEGEHPLTVDPSKVQLPPFWPDTDSVRYTLARHYSNIARMDSVFGQRIREVEQAGLLDSTIIVFYSDHGDGLPRFKRAIHDTGLHTPFIIRYPDGHQAGTVDDRLLSFVDIAPTLLSLVGVQPSDDFHGHAFAGDHATNEGHDYVFAALDRVDAETDQVRSVRSDSFRYVRNYFPGTPEYLPVSYRLQVPFMAQLLRMRDAGQLDSLQQLWFEPRPAEQLFDVVNDPWELHNLANDPAYADKLEHLSAVLDEWIVEFGDQAGTTEVQRVQQVWPSMVQPQTAPAAISREGNTLTLSCATEGAYLGYRAYAKGDTPPETWTYYWRPVEVPQEYVVEAYAHRPGWKESDVEQL